MSYPIHPAANALPMLKADELQALADNIKREGLQVPITVVDGQVIDGRNRLKACEMAGVPPVYDARNDIEDIPMWVWSLNAERRHLSSQEQKVLIWKKLYGMSEEIQAARAKIKEDERKAKAGNTNAAKNKVVQRGQPRFTGGDFDTKHRVIQAGVPCVDDPEQNIVYVPPKPKIAKSRELVAEAAKVNKTAVARAEALERKAPELAGKVASGELTFSQAAKKANVHVSNNSGENEWYTPPAYIEAAREVMGGIDCDPASNDVAQKTVKADKYYTIENSGLDDFVQWNGRIWMNPPYESTLIKAFVEKLVDEFMVHRLTEACVLVNNATETAWFQSLASVASAVGFTRGRVRFLDPQGKPGGAPLQGQAVIYIGENVVEFANAFSGLCWIAEVHHG